MKHIDRISVQTVWLALSVLLLSFLACLPAQAQSAAVSGLVIDPSGTSVPNVQITFTNERTGVVRHSKTDNVGMYSLPFVQPGKYTLCAEASGFKRFEEKAITVDTAQKLAIDVKLQVGGTSESVTVDGSGVRIDTTDGSVSAVVDRQFVENMPMNGRSFQSLETLAPGVTQASGTAGLFGDISVNGQRTESNYYTVDGVSVTNGLQQGNYVVGLGAAYGGAVANTTVLGTTQPLISVDAMEEFRVSTSTYSAETGRGAGGQFAFTSRAGTDQWHGALFDYFRNEALDANNWFNDDPNWHSATAVAPLRKEKERQNDYGGTVGGPARIPHLYNGADKTFFFFNYEGLQLYTPQAATTFWVPDAGLRAAAPSVLQPLLNAFPQASPASVGGEDFSDGMATYITGFSNPSSINSFGLRIDHSLNSKIKLFGRYNHAPNTGKTLIPGQGQTEIYALGNDSGTFGATAMITPSLSNEFRYNIAKNTNDISTVFTHFGNNTFPDLASVLPGYPNIAITSFYLDFYADTGVGGSNGIGNVQRITTQTQNNGVDTLSKSVGRHMFKFGVDYRRLANNILWSTTQYTEGTGFYTEASLLANSSGVSISNSPWAARPVFMNLSLFAQDEWKVTSRLNLSLGLRWDINPAPTDVGGHLPYSVTETSNLANATLQNNTLFHTDYTGFAPRAGFAYQVGQTPERETIVRGGFGMYYDANVAQSVYGYSGPGFTQNTYSTMAFPVSTSDIAAVGNPAVIYPLSGNTIYSSDPNLHLPYTLQWNTAVEQALGKRQKFVLNYVGAAGQRQTAEQLFVPSKAGNANWGAGTQLDLISNGATSSYNAMQLEFQRVLSHGLQAFAAYTWSHAIDTASSNNFDYQLQKASADYDRRQNLQAAITYDLPGIRENNVASIALSHWSIDTRLTSVTAAPVNVYDQYVSPTSGLWLRYHPNLVPGVPLYVPTVAAVGKTPPGGRAINYAAFTKALDSTGAITEGNAGRNSARGFGATELDMALRKDFHLAETLGLQFRAEAFNILNHPQFGTVTPTLSSGSTTFGTATNTTNSYLGTMNSLYQTGGPRSLQLALRLHF
jgi:hypothetical protein